MLPNRSTEVPCTTCMTGGSALMRGVASSHQRALESLPEPTGCPELAGCPGRQRWLSTGLQISSRGRDLNLSTESSYKNWHPKRGNLVKESTVEGYEGGVGDAPPRPNDGV